MAACGTWADSPEPEIIAIENAHSETTGIRLLTFTVFLRLQGIFLRSAWIR